MNTSFNVDDYQDLDTFLTVLKRGLSSKGKSLRKKWANSLTAERLSDITLTDYLYYRMLEDDTETAYEVNGTHSINVEEEGGSGAYYIYAGDRRKKDNEVTIEIKPPDDKVISAVTCNEDRVYYRLGNVFTFTMPDTNADIVINYSESSTLMIIYFGSSDITTIYNPENGVQAIYSSEGVTLPFNNSSPEYIWFASPVQMSIVEAFGHQANIEETFDVQEIYINGIDYYLYVHKWKTQVNNLTFYN